MDVGRSVAQSPVGAVHGDGDRGLGAWSGLQRACAHAAAVTAVAIPLGKATARGRAQNADAHASPQYLLGWRDVAGTARESVERQRCATYELISMPRRMTTALGADHFFINDSRVRSLGPAGGTGVQRVSPRQPARRKRRAPPPCLAETGLAAAPPLCPQMRAPSRLTGKRRPVYSGNWLGAEAQGQSWTGRAWVRAHFPAFGPAMGTLEPTFTTRITSYG